MGAGPVLSSCSFTRTGTDGDADAAEDDAIKALGADAASEKIGFLAASAFRLAAETA